jgi:signal transduction histidine kinase
MTQFETFVIPIVLVGFALLLLMAMLRLRSQQPAVYHLSLHAGFGFLASLSKLVQILEATTLPTLTLDAVTEALLLATALSFGVLTINFLQKKPNLLIGYWLGALILLSLWITLIFNFWNLADILVIPGFNVALIVAGLAWLGALATSFLALGAEFKQLHPAKYLNRLRYWLIAATLLAAGGLIKFINPAIFYWAGLPLALVGSILAGYVVLSYHTRDLNLLVGHLLYNLGFIGAVSVIFYFSLTGTVIISRNAPNYITFVWSVILAVLLALLTPLTQQLLNRILTRIIYGTRYRDPKAIIRYYNESMSGALDMQRLANTIISLMVETLGIRQGVVFVNQRDIHEPHQISLHPLSSVGMTNLSGGHFAADSLVIDHFRKGQKVLYQYDLDVLPEFRGVDPAERNWLKSLRLELYVPILRHRELVGALAFGSRSQGTSYPKEEIDLMIALADQAALAMDSARLFEWLTTTTQEKGSLIEQLAGLDKNKADFLSIASHELRTPLTHIHGYSKILSDFSEEEFQNTTQVKAILEAVIKSSERMKNVVDVMFDVSEVNVGDLTLFSGPVNLENMIDQAARPYLSTLDERRIAFGKNGFEQAPIVEADATRLVQAFENLISNAIKYTPDGGLITVICRSVLDDKIGGQAVEIVVADNGIGIDPKYHERIFDKFFRIDDTEHHSTSRTKFKGAGPGLGLTLVKGIAEAHGGRVWVESLGYDEVNYPGSKFFFLIPLHAITQSLDEDAQKQSQIKTIHWRRDKDPKSNA